MLKKTKVKISLFSGGSGNLELVKLLNNLDFIDLTIIINGYDDGKSTGELRKFMPNFLGPSDFRKNMTNLINTKDNEGKILSDIFRYRLNKNVSKFFFLDFLSFNNKNKLFASLNIEKLSFYKYQKLKELFYIFKTYAKNKKFKINDMSLGNIIIAAAFLQNNKNFNKAVQEVKNFLNLNCEIVNVTDGKNLFLSALLENGNYIENEEELVIKSHKFRIDDIYLLNKKFNKSELIKLKRLNFREKKHFLEKKTIYPKLNEVLPKIFKNSDIIIFGPGTQHSSLYPSYLTKDLRDQILDSKAIKFLITNIFYDKDILNESAESVISKFYYFLSKNKKKLNKNFIDFNLVNKIDHDDINLKKNNYLKLSSKKSRFELIDWEKASGVHYPNILLKHILKLSKIKISSKKVPASVLSIIVPCLNEKHGLRKTLNKLNKMNFEKLNMLKEIIIVDGGSVDGSVEIVKEFKKFKFYRLQNAGKGDCIKLGIQKSKGDIITFFPSDDEYDVNDIKNVVLPIVQNQSKAVFGSRMIKCLNFENRLKQIYKNNYFTMLLSKYGGRIVNLIILFLYNRSISDPFSSLKAYDAQTIKNMKLVSRDFDLDFELFCRLCDKNNFILEVPVNFKPRKYNRGKKMNVLSGIKCLFYLIKHKIIN